MMDLVKKMESRRTYLRIPFATVAELSTGSEARSALFVRDLSVYGMGGYVHREYQLGQSVLVRLNLTTLCDEVIEESIMSQIRWSKRLEGECNFALGLIFHKMAERQSRLYCYLKDLEVLSSVT